LQGHLKVLGGGLDITVFSGLPQGSGLGSSSILGAAVLACLARVRGEECSHAELIVRTSALEQRMTSGGGWQDQAGGIVPGVKLMRTGPGLVQIPSLQWTPFGGAGVGAQTLRSRMLLLFTGQKRVARNILRTVVGRYLAREPEVLDIIDRLKHGAEEAAQALAAGDIIEFAARLNEYWELKKAYDPGSTNAEIETILAHIAPYTAAACGCGASGGGFMTILARDNEAADAIRQVVKRNLPHPNARFFDWEIDETGLAVSVL
jgi:fucokinase